ncbi:flagellar basal-body MS-ring/collar protein FliF [Candidatus Berkiella aquae]|uniref:Flagellar M-ring protein n=1 Tax=Candidatus Berkiella aquae TaxID=295108 RepID=A0A0Q9YXN2_9GAMM|nr:flagellar basal-body MS-ring/collar protein FliF [Candidatus Berkiella aquae]MCS5711426.1 flagellar M-ring protein FliF [Candidatus Berkiella aquae]
MTENSQSKGTLADGYFELPIVKQLGLFIGFAASIALAIYVVMWSKTPDYIPLYSQLNSKDSGDVVEALQRQNIPFKVDEKTGLVLVDANKVHEARIRLAGEGVPSHSGNGFAGLLDKDSVFGTSQFIERARYIHALEGELEKTIASIENIKSARVHLAVPKQTAFIKDKKEPSASVFVDIYGGRRLEPEQVSSITHLVASSIQGLSAQHVTVIDQNGKLLSSSGSDEMSVAAKQLDYTHKLERVYAQRIQDLLSPILGYDRIKAEVTATMDFTSSELTSENYDPTKTALRSERISDVHKEGTQSREGGVPGTLSNQAPGTPHQPAPNQKPGQPGQEAAKKPREMAPGVISLQETKNFEIDRQIKHQVNLPGKLQRLSVGVVVDDKTVYDSNGTATKVPLKPEEIQKIETLVKDAIGFETERGDRVTVINSSFAQVEPIQELPKQSIMEKPWFWMIVKQSLAGVAILTLILVVLRPLLKNLTSISDYKQKMLMQTSTDNVGGILDKKGKKIDESDYHVRVKELINEDPKKAAQVIKQWVGIEHEKSS